MQQDEIETTPIQTKSEKFKSAAKEFFTTKRMVYIAVFSAIAAVLYIFNPLKDVPLVIFPAFFDFKICDVPALISGFMLGPGAGAIVVVIKVALKMASGRSDTLGVGELSDLLLGLSFVVTASLIYKKHKSAKGAAAGLAIGSAASVAMAVFANWLLIVPFFVFVRLNGNWDILLGMVRPLYPNVTRETFFLYYIPFAVIPFNMIRVSVASLLSYGLYRALKKADRKLFPEKSRIKTENIPESGETDDAAVPETDLPDALMPISAPEEITSDE